MKKISIGSWAYTIGPYAKNPVAWDEVIKKVKGIGFDGVELGGFPPHPNPDNMPLKKQRNACKKQLKDVGLDWSGLAADLWSQHLIDSDDNSAYLACFRKNLQFCVDLGIPAIRVDAVQPPTIFDKVDPDTARQRVVKTWKVCAAEAADKGVRMAWEFEPGFAFNKPSDIVRIVEEVGHGNFGVMFDTCHGYMVSTSGARQPGKKEILPGGVVELAKKLRGKIKHIHLIDSDGTLHNNETSTHTPFGQGKINFDELLPELAKNDMGHDWWTIDLCFWADAWAVTEQCKKAVDELNRKYG
ncbi:MAG: sugar phosphate isomerase/epimerase [Sedimentisphaerales bacterium]|jgi:sugar phosphate isomerase/epimerase|nr:sugar phosphate isomerase/epimerase [Sedimentisphaerales bacterium]